MSRDGNGVEERVVLHVRIQCHGCSRKLETSESLDGDSVRTGNTTQNARYWLDSMTGRILHSAEARQWKRRTDGTWRCSHCIAVEVDPLGTPRVDDTAPDSNPMHRIGYGRGDD